MEMSEKIIVIDDNPEIREVVNVLLSSEGYTILEAKNAEEALEQIDASIDLIIGYISKMVNSRNRINEKIIFLHVNNTEEICDLMHSFLD